MHHSTLWRAPLVGALATFALVGCTPPAKIVTHISSARDQIKFLYQQGAAQGVVKCQVGPDGALAQCRNMAINVDD